MTPAPRNAAIAARDLGVVWHPCTQMQDLDGITKDEVDWVARVLRGTLDAACA